MQPEILARARLNFDFSQIDSLNGMFRVWSGFSVIDDPSFLLSFANGVSIGSESIPNTSKALLQAFFQPPKRSLYVV